MDKQPGFIKGGVFKDERGIVSFINDFDMQEVRRLYHIEHPDTEILRAWQGHKAEQKWFYVTNGGFKIAVIKPDDWEKPTQIVSSNQYVLNEEMPGVLHVPGGYVTGFRAVEKDSSMIVFSDFTIEQSKNDDYRFDKNTFDIDLS
jgi:dTDP-4-dehydrorhamnose 3,5-epimerase-like enzyme